ncbi:ArsR/SmtB family transcription factor [Lignipirellula cremea]|nr:metalloregulator ArsR/SmtB family transcription factor [Lignipirellula cremea]
MTADENDAAGEQPLTRMSDKAAGELKTMFFLFADQSRLRILHFLMQRPEMNVRTLCQMLGQSQPAVSHHLGLMRAHGLIACRRDGKHNYYGIVSDRFGELFETLFESLPSHNGSFDLGGFRLSYAPDKNDRQAS